MNSNLCRSLTVFSFSTLILLSSAFAVDLRASEAEFANEALSNFKTESMLEELNFLSLVDPFPIEALPAIDPFSKKKVDQVSTGPAFRTRSYGTDYDYYRYVTYYNVSYRKERIYDLPIQRAQCYEKSEIFGNYNSSKTYTATVTASATLEGLGLSAALSDSRTFGTGRGITATGGIVADYTPYMLQHDWEGRTFIQLMNSKTGELKFLNKETKLRPWWVILSFPLLNPLVGPLMKHQSYPMAFRIKNADRTFLVDRKIIEECDPKVSAQ